jgi:hypothetical protein
MIGKRFLTAAVFAASAVGLALGSTAASAAVAPGSVHQNLIKPMWSCDTGTSCTASVANGTTLYLTAGGTENISGDTVTIQCWYTAGAPKPDGYWDHVINVGGVAKQGHVSDEDVLLGGETAKDRGLPECG